MEELWKPTPTEEKHVMAEKQLAGWKLAYWGLWFLFESWWKGPDFRYQTLCIPRRVMDAMLLTARKHASSHKGLDEFITEGDVLVALACRMAAEGLPSGSNRPLTTFISVDPRKRLESVFRQDSAYVQNAPVAAYFECTAAEALRLPLGELAQRCRQTINTQCTEEQLKAMARIALEARKTKDMEPVFGDKNMQFQFVTNWSKGGMLESMDFSPAVVKPALGTGAHKTGHPLWYNTVGLHQSQFSLSIFSVSGRDHLGNMWLSADLPRGTWSAMLSYLGSFAPS
jgi:hypothetical protein